MASIGATTATTGRPERRADVELRLPADSAFASVLRTTTAGLAARLDFPIDDIEDLRIAVGEASAMVLPEAAPGSDLTCRFYMAPAELTVTVAVGVDGAVSPDYDSFAWQVLTTLASHASAETSDGAFSITLTMESGHPEIGN
ncbi:anti-sigma factor [Nocardioides aquiterrae]|uniref:Anti-sigma regulatory factor n=1 Tax=Nocardioides aquiterrae TaxID=203799 RepID=A0ABN1UB92_9ACTN